MDTVVSAAWPVFLGNPTIPGLPNLSRATVAGIAVAISGNVLISLALNCQKLAHLRLERARELKRVHSTRSGSPKQNGHRLGPGVKGRTIQEAHEAEWENELTPTNGGRPEAGYSQGAESGSASAASETQPLLLRTAEEDTVYVSRKASPISRLNRWAKRADHAHASSVHPTMAVDVLAVRPPNGHTPSEDDKEEEEANEGAYLKSKLWWLGFTLMTIGEMGNFISYAFAPASIVAPLGTFALIANCVFAPLMLSERFRKRDFLGIIVAVVGAVTVVLSANQSDTQLDPDALIHAISQRPFVIFSIVYVIAAIILTGLSEGSIGRRYVFVDVGLCAIFGGFTVLSTKAISTLLTKEWFEIFTEWITYPTIAVLLGTGVGQVRYLNRALMRFDSKIVVPSQFVTFNLSAIVGSAILYGDFKRASFHQIVTFLYGCAATFAGVFLIAWAPNVNEGSVHDDEDEEASIMGTGDDRVLPRDARVGSLSRRERPTLIIPEGVVDNLGPDASPILRSRQSLVSMIGLSPAQRVLVVHTPPRDEFIRTLSQEFERDAPEHTRRRAVSWIHESSPQSRGADRRVRSHVASRDGSLTRTAHASLSPRVGQSQR